MADFENTMSGSLKLQDIKPHIISNVKFQIQQSKIGKQSSTLWIGGPPGLGKSEFMKQVCEELGWGLKICYLSQMTIEQMSGMPMVKVTGEEGEENKFVPWSIPQVFNFSKMEVKPAPLKSYKDEEEFVLDIDEPVAVSSKPEKKGIFSKSKNQKEFSNEEKKSLLDKLMNNVNGEDEEREQQYTKNELESNKSKAKEEVPIVLFFDDSHLPDRSIQKYLFQLLGEKTIQSHTLPPNVAIILAGNRAEDKAGFQQILAPIANRIRWVDVKYDLDSWVNNFAIPANIRLDVISFLQTHTTHFSGTPKESAPWPSPRSWTYASQELDVFKEVHGKLSIEDAHQIVKGQVGDAGASAFTEYRTLLMQWEADRILSGDRRVVEKKSDRRGDDIWIGAPGEEGGLGRMECYALMAATIGSLIKHLREVNFNPTERENQMIDLFKDIMLKRITKKYREIVPLGLRSVLAQERQIGSRAITRRLLTDNEVVILLAEIIK